MENDFGRAIVIVPENGVNRGKKYNNVKITESGRLKFMKDMKILFPAATAVNFYTKDRIFIKQERFL